MPELTPPEAPRSSLEGCRALAAVARATVRATDPAAVMQTALDTMVAALGLDVGTFQLVQGEELTLAAQLHCSPETARELARVPLSSDRLSTRCYRQNQPIVVTDTSAVPASSQAIRREALVSVVAVPVPGPQGAVGVLVVGSRTRREVTRECVLLLEAIADVVGVALQNAQLYQDLQRHKDRLEALLREQSVRLEQAESQLVQRERLVTLGQLAGSLGHDLRGPLVNMRMMLGMLCELPADAPVEVRQDAVNKLDQELTRCSSVINDLLDYTRGREPRRVPSNLTSIVHQALRTLANQPELEVEVVSPELERISLDPDQVLRLFENLLHNAVEATGGRGRIRVTLAEAGPELEVRVEDSGPGVPEDMRERIFEPLVTTRRSGTGLGLAVCRRTVDSHGGEIRVERSADLGGASFVLRLPRAAS